MEYVVTALYHFADLSGLTKLREDVQRECARWGIQGTLILAKEGINGTIAGQREGIDEMMAFLRRQRGLQTLSSKESIAEHRPFYRMKVKLKEEIVTMGVDGVRPADGVGEYVEPEAWNDLIAREDVVVVDTRNGFEHRVGRFQGAVDAKTQAFSDFPEFAAHELDPHRDKQVAMYCAGGIRCEKATAYLLDRGFENVYHLKGGILKYLERVPASESLWEGECFVFDQRVSVKHGLAQGTYELCYGCQSPVSEAERKEPSYERGVSCSYCFDTLTEKRLAALRERVKQVHLSALKGLNHIGQDP